MKFKINPRGMAAKLTAFVLCSVAIVGIIASTVIAVITSNFSGTSSFEATLKKNIAGNYCSQMIYEYVHGDKSAMENMADNTNMRLAAVSSDKAEVDGVDTASEQGKLYGNVSTLGKYDYVFRISADDLSGNSPSSLIEAIIFNDRTKLDVGDLRNNMRIERIVYSTQTKLFYVFFSDGNSYIIPKVRIYMTDENGNDFSALYEITEITDGEQTSYAYQNVFSGDLLDSSAIDSWYNVTCYDMAENSESYYFEAAYDSYEDDSEIYVTASVNAQNTVLPQDYEFTGTYEVYYPYDSENTGFYWVFVKMPDGKLADKGDFFNKLEPFLDIMGFVERNITALYIIFVAVFLFTAGYLLVTAGKRKGSEEIKMRLIDRMPYIIVFCIFSMGIALLCEGMFYMLEHVGMVMVLALLCAMIGLEFLLTTYVRLRSHTFIRYTACYYAFSLAKKIWEHICSPVKKVWGYMTQNVPLFVMGSVAFAFFFVCEFVTSVSMAYGLYFIIKIIEYGLFIVFILQFDAVRKAARRISQGDLSQPLDIKSLIWIFKTHGQDLNNVSDGIENAVQEKMKSERFRTELITNVSHDIKTPLTSIINYVDLLEKEDIDNEKAKEYLEVLDRQSARLKKLIADLLEASKASTGNLKVDIEELDAAVLISQVAGEYTERFTKKGLELVLKNETSPVMINADGRHLWRVFDNLMNNIFKYAQEGTRVYIDVIPKDNGAVITFKNISKCPLNISSEELMERFVRGDSSRNTEGSGLGLSIAQSLMQLMNGNMELTIDGDLFKVTLEFFAHAPSDNKQ